MFDEINLEIDNDKWMIQWRNNQKMKNNNNLCGSKNGTLESWGAIYKCSTVPGLQVAQKKTFLT